MKQKAAAPALGLNLRARATALAVVLLAGIGFMAQAQGEDVVSETAALSVAARPWSTLTTIQQRILATLEPDWGQMAGGRQQKWLELSDRLQAMPAAERYRVQVRMAEWARLSPAQRSQARLQFLDAKQLPPPQLRNKWQEYQSLSEVQRQELAAQAQRPPSVRSPAAAQVSLAAPLPAAKLSPSSSVSLSPAPDRASTAAVAVAPTGATTTVATGKHNLVIAPALSQARQVTGASVQAKPGATIRPLTSPVAPPSHHQPGLPKIAATAGFVDPATLLPKRGPQGAAVTSALAASSPASQP